MTEEFTSERVDPAPDPVTVVRERSETLVKDISNTVLTELADLRDKIDSLMHSIKARETAVINSIGDLAQDAASAIQMKQVIADGVAVLQKQIQPTGFAPATITQSK